MRPDTSRIEKVAKKTGLTPEQVAAIVASAGDVQVIAIEGGTITPRVMYSPERLAARRAEREAEQAELETQWRAKVAARRNSR